MVRTKYSVLRSEAERAHLHTLVGQGTAPARLLAHARIRLKANQGEAGPGWTHAAIATALEVGLSTLARVRQRYVTDGVDAALNRKGPDREHRRKLDGEQEARLVALACRTPPAGADRWTMQLLTERFLALAVSPPVSDETVRRTLQQTRSSRG